MKQFLLLLVSLSLLLPVSMEAHGDCDKTSAFLGIQSKSISKEKAEKLGFENPYGSYVTKVYENSAAERAGLQIFDYIYWVGRFVACHDRNLSTMLGNYESGDEVEVKFVRNGELKTTFVKLGKRSDVQNNNKSCGEKAFLGIDQNWRVQREVERGVGVNVVNNSTAEAMGLEDGDVITSINDYPMMDWNDITTAIYDLKVGDNITVEFIREGQSRRANMPIQSYSTTKNTHSKNSHVYSGGGQDYYEEEEDDENREYGFLGVYTEKVSKEKAQKLGFDNPYGSYVTGTIPGTAAEKAGVQPFDYIYGVDQYRTGEHQNLTHVFRKYEPNDKGVLQLIRNKRKQTITVTFGRRDDVRYTEKSKCDEPFFGIRHDHSGSNNVDGVAIEVVKNSTAKGLGLQNGDIITKINGHYMIDWTDIGIAIDNMTVGNSIEVNFSRDGRTMTKQGPIKSYCDTKPEYQKNEQVWNKYKDKHKEKKKDDDYDYDNGEDDDFFDNDFSIPEYSYKNSEELNMSNITIRIADVNASESIRLQQRYGHKMGSNLEVDDFRLAKNTNQNLFDLTFNLPNKGATIVKIINEDGRVIYEYDLGQFSGDFSDKVDISQNGAGAYFLSIQSGVKTKTKKIILAKR